MRGGRREKAGRKSTYRNTTTRITIPEFCAAQVLEIAAKLDQADTSDFCLLSIEPVEMQQHIRKIVLQSKPSDRRLISRALNRFAALLVESAQSGQV